MLARLFADGLHFSKLLCPDVAFNNTTMITANRDIVPLVEPPDLRQINSGRPSDNFANFYAQGLPCREAIIIQMNREAHSKGQTYLRKLFTLLRTEPIVTLAEIATAILLATDNDAAVKTFLMDNGCPL